MICVAGLCLINCQQDINIQNMNIELVAQMFKNYQSNVLFHLEGMSLLRLDCKICVADLLSSNGQSEGPVLDLHIQKSTTWGSLIYQRGGTGALPKASYSAFMSISGFSKA